MGCYVTCHIILAGDFNTMPDSDVVIASGLTSVVLQPTRGNNRLDRIYVSDFQYNGVKVVKSAVTSDHQAIVAYSGGFKATVGKTRRVCTFRKHTTAQHAHFLASVSASFHVVSSDGSGDPQLELTARLDATAASAWRVLSTACGHHHVSRPAFRHTVRQVHAAT